MKFRFLFLIAFFALPYQGKACDACGCSMMGSLNPLLSSIKYNYLGLGYSGASYQSIAESSQGSSDHFQQWVLNGQYQFNDRWRLSIALPLKKNSRTISNTTRSISGISDVQLNLSRVLLNTAPDSQRMGFFIELHGGILFPTGKYNSTIHQDELPENFNIGNGSFGYLVGHHLGLTSRHGGILLKNQYKTYLPSVSGYQYGSQWTPSLTAYATFRENRMLQLQPLVQLQYESIAKDRHANDNAAHGTGGHAWLMGIGIQSKIKSMLFMARLDLPIDAKLGDGEVAAKNRLAFSLSHLF